MQLSSAVVLGFALGVRHAADADHLAAIGALLGGRGGLKGAVSTAALWGGGHSVTFLGLGLVIVGAGVRLPGAFERWAELLVAAMLVGLGGMQLVRLRRASGQGEEAGAMPSWRPVVVGVIHGLAGSAGVALMALMTIPTRLGALLYLGLFGVGVVAGMVLITLLLGGALSWSARHARRMHQGVLVGASLASIVMGLLVAFEG
ncbi:MAG: hypothetical protein MUF64_00345 [Polyangiaceae bacterium]|nr:hypothetical protein [Polyangiaceae bacterium]